MRIALIGATGNVGSRVLAELVRRGHSVTVISRNPDRGPSLVDVISKRGNVIDQHGVAQQLKRHDAVICSFHRERTTQAAGSCARLWCSPTSETSLVGATGVINAGGSFGTELD